MPKSSRLGPKVAAVPSLAPGAIMQPLEVDDVVQHADLAVHDVPGGQGGQRLGEFRKPGGAFARFRPSIAVRRPRQRAVCVTGTLRTIAFGKKGMLIQSEPEFESESCVEGELDKLGILKDPEFAAVRGILFVVHPLSKPPQIWALFRNFDEISDNNGDVLEQVLKIVGKGWNDGVDTNGWQLR